MNNRDFMGTLLGLIVEGGDELLCFQSTLLSLAICTLSDGCKVYSKAIKCRNLLSLDVMLIDV